MRCGAELGLGRFCLNCGHPVGQPLDEEEFFPWRGEADPTQAVDDPARRRVPANAGGPPPLHDEAGGWHWLTWTIAAVLSVALVLALARLLAPDDGPVTEAGPPAPSPPSTTEGAEDGGQQATRPRPRNLVRGARVEVPATAPPTTDLDGSRVTFDARHIVDLRRATAWRMPGDATGTAVTIILPRKARLRRVGLVNGYAKKISGVDWYVQNRRILAVTWRFDNGRTVNQTFGERPAMQLKRIKPVTTGSVMITIRRVTPPGAGTLGRDYTAISGVALIGRPAR